MARMYPVQISSLTTSSAERVLFNQLKLQLSDDWIVMHSVKWLTRSRKHDAYGEADFVIAHPDRGVLVLEVKGGRIIGQWADDDWFSVDRSNRKHPIKNPVKQATNAMWTLRDRLHDAESTRRYQFPFVFGVAFPDMIVASDVLGIDIDRSLVIDSSDMPMLVRALDRTLSIQPPHKRLSSSAIEALVDLIQPIVEISRFGLAAQVMSDEEQIIRLTETQRSLLGFLSNHRRVVIDGCAGSGKTMLAMEKAIQLAEEGLNVLLTCFNRNLAVWMRQAISLQSTRLVTGTITVSNYHDLAVRFCEEAGKPSTVDADNRDYWDSVLPSQLLAAIPHLPIRFDAIVADEGQDFEDIWWLTLMELLRDPEDGVFYIFQDEQQDLYRRRASLPFTTAPFTLQENLRNTTSIHRRVAEYYEGYPKPLSLGPQGREIEIIATKDSAAMKTLGQVVHRLLVEEGLQPGQIVVLTPHGRERSALREQTSVATSHLTWNTQSKGIRVSSIHGFKGLESDIVILAETDRLIERDDGQLLCYVALSRAKHHLIVLGELPPVVRSVIAPASMKTSS